MAVSRPTLAVAAALAFALGACDVLLGLNQYHDVDCAFDCGVDSSALPLPDASDSGPDVRPDVGPDVAAEADAEASVDAPLEGTTDAPLETSPVPEGGYPTPPPHEAWAHWVMPNPDASLAPTIPGSPALPNQMAFDAGADGGAGIALDLQTGLAWWRASLPASSLDQAWMACGHLSGGGWRVPSRIELITLVDFTRLPTLDPATFPDGGEVYWSASPNAGSGGGTWSVSFKTGLAATPLSETPTLVLCVNSTLADGGGP